MAGSCISYVGCLKSSAAFTADRLCSSLPSPVQASRQAPAPDCRLLREASTFVWQFSSPRFSGERMTHTYIFNPVYRLLMHFAVSLLVLLNGSARGGVRCGCSRKRLSIA